MHEKVKMNQKVSHLLEFNNFVPYLISFSASFFKNLLSLSLIQSEGRLSNLNFEILQCIKFAHCSSLMRRYFFRGKCKRD